MISRRTAMLGLAAALPASSGAIAADTLAFRVSRNGTLIGTHKLTFKRLADGVDIQIEVDIAVAFGPLKLYRYTLRGLEQWRGGQVARVQARTNNDGDAEFIDAMRDTAGLWVSGSDGPRYLAPPDALPATHWNRSELDGPWINPQNGKLLRPSVTESGQEELNLPGGRRVVTSRFTVSGDVHLELWYDTRREWTALRAPGKDGSTITYDLI